MHYLQYHYTAIIPIVLYVTVCYTKLHIIYIIIFMQEYETVRREEVMIILRGFDISYYTVAIW